MGRVAADVHGEPDLPQLRQGRHIGRVESADWLASVAVWETGELDLDAIRKAYGWHIVKHYDLEAAANLRLCSRT
jgi:hypothetical protein